MIATVEKLYLVTALEAACLYNNVEKKRSYYAVPLHQATIHIFYWRDLLQPIGHDNIPHEWNAFWEFWKQAQNKLRSQQTEIYGLGLPMSIGASDTYYVFEQILEAYNVQILDAQGQLQIDPLVRQGIIDSLDWYATLYQQRYVPPTAVKWLDPDNNRSLLNRDVVMTPNPTLSIPIALRQDPDTYRNKLGILEFPNKPNGQPMRHLVSIRQAVVFAESKNQEAAKDFLAYLTQPEVLESYLESAGGRYLPVTISAREDPFWTDPENPHLSTASQTLSHGQTRPFSSAQNPAYSLVLQENVWGKALERIIIDGVSPEQAADEAITHINEIFDEWQ